MRQFKSMCCCPASIISMENIFNYSPRLHCNPASLLSVLVPTAFPLFLHSVLPLTHPLEHIHNLPKPRRLKNKIHQKHLKTTRKFLQTWAH